MRERARTTVAKTAAMSLLAVALLSAVIIGVVGCGPGSGGEAAQSTWPTYAAGAPTLFPITDGGLVGYIDKGGSVVISPRYAEAGPFSEGLAAVRLRPYGPWGYIDQAGDLVIEPRFAEVEAFSEGLAPVREVQDGPWGFIDITGELVIGLRFGAASVFSEGLARVRVGNATGYVDTVGEWAIQMEYLEAVGGFSGGLALVYDREVDRYGYIEKDGELVLGAERTITQVDSGEEGAEEGAEGDGVGTRVVPGTRFLEAWDFSEGVAAVRPALESGEAGLYGYVDRSGDWLIEPQFADARPFSGGLAAVQSTVDGMWGYVDVTGSESIAPRWHEADTFRGGLALVSLIVGVDQVGESVYGCAYIDITGEIVWQDKAMAGFDPTATTTTTLFIESTTTTLGEGETPSTVIYGQ